MTRVLVGERIARDRSNVEALVGQVTQGTSRFRLLSLPGLIGLAGFLLLPSTLATGCGEQDCRELIADAQDEIAEVRRACECDFNVECRPRREVGEGKTTKGADGKPLIQLPVDGKVTENTLKHEMIHALKRCRNFDQRVFPTPPGAVGTNAEVIFLFRRRLLNEYLAYRLTEEDEDFELRPEFFPEADDDDDAVVRAYLNAIRDLDAGDKALVEAGLGVSDKTLRADNDAYQRLKRSLVAQLEPFKTELGDCLDVILDF